MGERENERENVLKKKTRRLEEGKSEQDTVGVRKREVLG